MDEFPLHTESDERDAQKSKSKGRVYVSLNELPHEPALELTR